MVEEKDIANACRSLGGKTDGDKCILPMEVVKNCNAVGGEESSNQCIISKEKFAKLVEQMQKK